MSKTIIEVKCVDQVLTLTNTPVIATGGMGEDYVSFEFCEKWDGYAVSAVFWRKGVDCIPVLLDAENTCQVPPELMLSEGIVYFGAVGVAPDGTTRTSEPVSYLIREGTITENTALPIPGEDVFQQLMSYYADVKLYVSTRVDDAADLVETASGQVSAAEESAEEARTAAEAAVESVESIIYPGVVAGYLPEAGSIGVTLDRVPSDKMILTFRAPFNDGSVESLSVNAIKVAYPDSDGEEKTEFFMLRDGYQSTPPGEAIGFGDVVTIVLVRAAKNEAFILNPGITRTTLNNLGSLIHPGQPYGYNDNGGLKVSLERPVTYKMILYFNAACDSSTITNNKMVVEYEAANGDLVQKTFTLYENGGDYISKYTFKNGDRVIAFLSGAENRAVILNPRMTKEMADKIAALETPAAAGGGCEILRYTGDGTSSQVLEFSKLPSVIQIESVSSGGYFVSALLFREENIAKLRVFSDGSYWETVVSLAGYTVWNKDYVMLGFAPYTIQAGQLNVNGTKYVAMGFV